jgi:hypothetical protein
LTFRGVLLAIRRRWYVVIVTLLVAAVAWGALYRDGGTYTTKTIVAFLVPATTTLSPDNGSNDDSVIAFARSVAAQVNVGRNPVSYSMDTVPYYGAGLRQAVLVDVPNAGNQWYDSFNRAEIDIQIVGRTEQWVKTQQTMFVNKVRAVSEAQQAGLVSDHKLDITTSVVPITQDITYVGPTRSAQIMALTALFFAAVLVGGWAAVTLDRRISRKRSAPRPVARRPARLDLKGSMI